MKKKSLTSIEVHMEKLKLIIAIADRGSGERMSKALVGAGCQINLQLAGHGTAKAAWLEYLGLEDTRKDVFFSLCRESLISGALDALSKVFPEEQHYLAVTISLSSIAGMGALRARSEGEDTHE